MLNVVATSSLQGVATRHIQWRDARAMIGRLFSTQTRHAHDSCNHFRRVAELQKN